MLRASGLYRGHIAQRTDSSLMHFFDRFRRNGFGFIARLAGFVLLTAVVAGCADDKNAVPPDEPADKLYNEGLTLLNQKEFKDSAKKFEEVDRQHPYSDWGRKSLLMAAFAYYQASAYDETISAAKRYITLHPGSPDTAYAQYLAASAYFDQIPDVNRDQARTQKAMEALAEVARKYPNTEYAESAKKKIDIARDNLAGKEMTIGRFYLEKRDFVGAINRFKTVVTQYQTTRHVEEALMRLTECYMALGIVGEAQTAAAVLGHNFPDSPWYQDAYKLVQSGGTEPRENKDSWMSKLFQGKST
jgi:outer membrane protein assembly factor BamD